MKASDSKIFSPPKPTEIVVAQNINDNFAAFFDIEVDGTNYQEPDMVLRVWIILFAPLVIYIYAYLISRGIVPVLITPAITLHDFLYTHMFLPYLTIFFFIN